MIRGAHQSYHHVKTEIVKDKVTGPRKSISIEK